MAGQMIVARSPEASLVKAPMQNSSPSGSAIASTSADELFGQSSAAEINDEPGRRIDIGDGEVQVHPVLHGVRLVHALQHESCARRHIPNR